MQIYIGKYKGRYIRSIQTHQDGEYGEELSFIIETTDRIELAKTYKDKNDFIQDLGVDNPNFEYKWYTVTLEEKESDNYDNYECCNNNLQELKKHVYLCKCEKTIMIEIESRADVI